MLEYSDFSIDFTNSFSLVSLDWKRVASVATTSRSAHKAKTKIAERIDEENEWWRDFAQEKLQWTQGGPHPSGAFQVRVGTPRTRKDSRTVPHIPTFLCDISWVGVEAR